MSPCLARMKFWVYLMSWWFIHRADDPLSLQLVQMQLASLQLTQP